MKRSRWRNGVLHALLYCGLFVICCHVEMALRAAKKEPIPVDKSLAPDVTISAARMPDFLWLGTAWWIDYESPVPFTLDIGSGTGSPVPAGKHRIHSNHDHRNLHTYGLSLSGQLPRFIIAKQTNP